ncbi:thiamine biosynthesis protein ApbE [Lysobacteraceae bacterium NML75-0749]|nr:thiamine biosynthesis protein ApbE [Xanthomonadaceae bacterium NML75-0749]PJK03099.1 thiamine biosynthesis protein ApbE [Xanthomonadaceae bacterium NML91-0268]
MPALSRLCAVVLPLLLAACQSGQVVKFSGPTMGSSYTISYVASGNGQTAALQQGVEAILAEVDQAVSTYRDDSALARFNAAAPGCMQMPEAAIALAAHAMELAENSEGAFDITLLPVVDAWGFGPKAAANPTASWSAPSDEQLAALRPLIGMQHLRIDGDTLCKDAPIQIDFNSMAAGYAIDRIADYLSSQGIGNFLIDVTGEMRGEGLKPGGAPWRIGIEAPLEDTRQAQKIIALSGQSISSSGDYRQYREVDGERQSHLIDPHSLRPVTHRLASVSVIHPSAMQADGLSTLLMVLGPERGLAYAEQHAIAALFISRSENGFETRTSRHFAALYPDGN